MAPIIEAPTASARPDAPTEAERVAIASSGPENRAADAAGPQGPSVAIGAILIALGMCFAILQILNPPVDWSRYGWPFFIVAPGAALFVVMALGGRTLTSLAVPASIVTVTGLILLYQNTFNHWESWAYAWALIVPTAVGLGRWIEGAWSGQPDVQRAGRSTALFGFALFLGFAAFFEGVLNISGLANGELVRFGLPLALILIGAYLLVPLVRNRPPAV